MSASSVPFVDHPSPRALAHALSEYAKGEGRTISLLLYEHFRPEDTIWWLCPGADNPAYHYGKYVIKTVSELEPASLFAGICFEKGVGAAGKAVFPKSKLTSRQWTWHSFVDALTTGGLDKPVQTAQDAAKSPVTVIVSLSVEKLPSKGKSEEDGYRDKDVNDGQRMYFRFDNGTLTLLKDLPVRDRLLAKPGDCVTLQDLAVAISGIKGLDWVWVSVEFGFLLANKEPAEPKWYTKDVWANACQPFVSWFR